MRVPKPEDYTPETEFPEGHRKSGMRRCKAWNSNHGRQCMLQAMFDKEVCRFHGAATPRGMASPHYKHGRYSKYIPKRMLEDYLLNGQDKEILALQDDIALLDSRISDLLKRVDTGESGWLWSILKARMDDLKKAFADQDQKAVNEIIVDIQRIVSRGHSDYAAWRDVIDMLERRRRLVDTERKRLVEMQQSLTVEQALEYMYQLGRAVKDNISDVRLLSRIQARFQELTRTTN